MFSNTLATIEIHLYQDEINIEDEVKLSNAWFPSLEHLKTRSAAALNN